MSARQYTLTACHFCEMGYPIRQLYEVEGYEKQVLICGPCYDKAQYGENLDGNPARERS